MKLNQLLFELSNLDRIPRTGLYQFLYEDFESIATHSYKVSFISYFLAKLTGANVEKTLIMAIFHDTAETRTGDSNWIQKSYITQNESLALEEQYKNIDSEISEEIISHVKTYKKRESLESKIVKDADYIEYFISLKLLDMKGNKEASKRLEYETKNFDFMYTPEGKNLLKEILKTDPNEWTREDHHQTMKDYKDKKK